MRRYIAICAGFASFGVLSILLNVSIIAGIVFILISIIGGILFYRSSIVKERKFETLADLLTQAGIKNAYSEKVADEMKRTGECNNAVRYLFRALELNPSDLQAAELLSPILTMRLASQYSLKGPKGLNPKEVSMAKHLVESGMKVAPTSHVFYDSLGIINDLEGNHEKARELFLTSRKYRSDPHWRVLLAESWLMSGAPHKALKEAERSLVEQDMGWNPRYVKGKALFALGKYNEAIVAFEEAHNIKGSYFPILSFLKDAYHFNGDFLKSALVGLQLGGKLFLVDNKNALRSIFGAIVTLCCVVLPIKLANIWWVVGKYIPKITVYPPVPELTLAGLALQRKHFEAAMELVGRIENLDQLKKEQQVQAHVMLSMSLAVLGRREESLAECDKAIAIDPEDQRLKDSRVQIASSRIVV